MCDQHITALYVVCYACLVGKLCFLAADKLARLTLAGAFMYNSDLFRIQTHAVALAALIDCCMYHKQTGLAIDSDNRLLR